MKVSVKLFAQYRDNRFKVREMELPEGTTVAELIEAIGLDLERYPLGIVYLNARHAEPDQALHDGDELSLFPKVGGG